MPATCSADSVTRAVAPSTMPMTISCTISTSSGTIDPMSTLIGVAMQRQDDQRQRQRDRQLGPCRNVGLAKARHQHHHRADAGEDQHEGGGERGQKRDIDAHDGIVHQPPMIRDDIRSM